MDHNSIKDIFAKEPHQQKIIVRGWLKTRRDAKGFSFLEVNDGSCLGNLQVIASSDLKNYTDIVLKLHTGCSLLVEGILNISPAKGQKPGN